MATEKMMELAAALGKACRAGKTAEAKQLVADGADANKSAEDYGRTPIEQAVNGGHEETARWLLGLNVKLPPGLLRTAAYSNHMWPPKFAWLVRELIEGGAD